jgi:uncharacterized protein
MIIQFSVENFKSIYKKATFSMLATKDQTHRRYLKQIQNFKILPSTIIVGANGAGKSNLFQALSYLQQIIIQSKFKYQIPYFPHKLEDHQETKLDIQFLMNDIRYAYGISLSNEKIFSEYLVKFIENNPIDLYYRDEETLVYHDESMSTHPLEVCLTQLSQNDDEINQVFDFITEKLVVVLADGGDEIRLFQASLNQFMKPENQKIVTRLIQKLDIGIKGLSVKCDEIIVEYERMGIRLLDESTGTKRLFMLLTVISDVINEGKVFFIDELERNLHIMLTRTIIRMFHNQEINANNAQLIFSTHNTNLLNLSLFRRDQVWFMEKNLKNLNTELYSLYNIMGVLDDENIEYGYINGRYGATFKINFDEVVYDDEE